MMIPDNLTQEQQHVKRILKNWSRIEKPINILSRLVCLMVLILLAVSHQEGRFAFHIALCAFLGIFLFYLYQSVSSYAIRRFASRLTEEEKTLLRNAIIDTTIEDNRTIKDILIASQKQGKHKTDLLRASQPPSDDTLLRPATQTEYPSTQQLMRAVPEENEIISA